MAVLRYVALVALTAAAGCTFSDNGSRTIVGDHFALPKLSSVDGKAELEIYESTEGAVVTTRKDSLVEIKYTNSYGSSILGIWEKVGEMRLDVRIEPLESGSGQ